MSITISHTHADGTLVYGTSKDDGTAAVLKAARFRWFPSIGLWGVPQSRDHLARRWQIDAAAEALRAAGHEVTVEIDDTPRDVAEVKADRAGRLEDRQEALGRKAERVQASALAHLAEADRIAAMRPFGQPILVGHHSERGARADQRRIERNMDKFCEEYGQAKETERRASVVGQADAYRELPPVIIRRIAKNEAELRKVSSPLTAENLPHLDRIMGAADAERAAAEREARRVFLAAQLSADQAALQAAKDAGYVLHSRETVHRGDRVHLHGRQWEVVRVSAKSVSVKTDYSWTDTVSYERIREVTCPHGGAQ